MEIIRMLIFTSMRDCFVEYAVTTCLSPKRYAFPSTVTMSDFVGGLRGCNSSSKVCGLLRMCTGMFSVVTSCCSGTWSRFEHVSWQLFCWVEWTIKGKSELIIIENTSEQKTKLTGTFFPPSYSSVKTARITVRNHPTVAFISLLQLKKKPKKTAQILQFQLFTSWLFCSWLCPYFEWILRRKTHPEWTHVQTITIIRVWLSNQ